MFNDDIDDIDDIDNDNRDGQDEDMASALLSHHKTDVNFPGRHGMTPLMYSAQAGHERMAVLLLRLRADRYRCNDQVCLLKFLTNKILILIVSTDPSLNSTLSNRLFVS